MLLLGSGAQYFDGPTEDYEEMNRTAFLNLIVTEAGVKFATCRNLDPETYRS